jgi:hypothetical protein
MLTVFLADLPPDFKQFIRQIQEFPELMMRASIHDLP